MTRNVITALIIFIVGFESTSIAQNGVDSVQVYVSFTYQSPIININNSSIADGEYRDTIDVNGAKYVFSALFSSNELDGLVKVVNCDSTTNNTLLAMYEKGFLRSIKLSNNQTPVRLTLFDQDGLQYSEWYLEGRLNRIDIRTSDGNKRCTFFDENLNEKQILIISPEGRTISNKPCSKSLMKSHKVQE